MKACFGWRGNVRYWGESETYSTTSRINAVSIYQGTSNVRRICHTHLGFLVGCVSVMVLVVDKYQVSGIARLGLCQSTRQRLH